MRYIITYVNEHGLQQAYYSDTFKDEDFDTTNQMLVLDTVEHKFKVNSLHWAKIDKDNLRH